MNLNRLPILITTIGLAILIMIAIGKLVYDVVARVFGL